VAIYTNCSTQKTAKESETQSLTPFSVGLFDFLVMLSFKDQIILITGAARGVGAAAALKFAEAGAAGVVINYRSQLAAAMEVAQEVERRGARALVLKADVAQPDESKALITQTLECFSRLDVLVANAGIWPAEDKPIVNLDEAQFDETIRVNVHGVYYVSRYAAEVFIKQRSGNIVTVSSTAGQRGEAGHADYAASKGAVISFTKSLASELGRYGVRVNSVAPGWVDTEMSAAALHGDEATTKQILNAIPLQRIATAEDVALPILFLASDLARHITGEVLNVNGGSILCG
jgi:3-oxoacyl-[acyl-carrier protein] reductase